MRTPRMHGRTWARIAAVGILAASVACTKNSSSTATPVAPSDAVVAPKIGAPTVQSPTNGQTAGSINPTLTATAATIDVSSFVLVYRFQVLDAGNLVMDSGLVAAPAWTSAAALTPNSRYSWRVRAESQGFPGPWSDTAAFATPEAPPPYNRPIGNWQACGAFLGEPERLSTCVWEAVRPTDSVSDFEVVKRVAWLLRGSGAGLLTKVGGDNSILWQGGSFSASRVCYPNGNIFKVIEDAGPGGRNAPTWADNDFVDPRSYVPAIDPSRP